MANSRRDRFSSEGDHIVWLKIPMSPMEVYGRYKSKRAAERIANALLSKYKSDYGKTESWVESPGSIEEKLRSMADDYGMDY